MFWIRPWHPLLQSFLLFCRQWSLFCRQWSPSLRQWSLSLRQWLHPCLPWHLLSPPLWLQFVRPMRLLPKTPSQRSFFFLAMYTITRMTTITTTNPTSQNDLLLNVEKRADPASSAT